MLLGLRIKALRIETQQQHLVEPRAVAHGAGLWVHRPAEGLLTVERQILGFQRLWGSSTLWATRRAHQWPNRRRDPRGRHFRLRRDEGAGHSVRFRCFGIAWISLACG